MSKELEALNEMLNKFVEILMKVKCVEPNAINILSLNNALRVAAHDKLDIVETALKRYNAIMEQKEDIINNNRAIEIIKEKEWLVEDILNDFIEDESKHSLLKEVFCEPRR